MPLLLPPLFPRCLDLRLYKESIKKALSILSKALLEVLSRVFTFFFFQAFRLLHSMVIWGWGLNCSGEYTNASHRPCNSAILLYRLLNAQKFVCEEKMLETPGSYVYLTALEIPALIQTFTFLVLSQSHHTPHPVWDLHPSQAERSEICSLPYRPASIVPTLPPLIVITATKTAAAPHALRQEQHLRLPTYEDDPGNQQS